MTFARALCFALPIASALIAWPTVAPALDCSVATTTDTCQSKSSKQRAYRSAKQTKPRESVDARQHALLTAAVGRLAPQRKGIADVYTIAVAAWADEDVFVKELDGTIASLAKVLPIEQRVLRLVNGPDPNAPSPLATRNNIAAAVRAESQVMAKDEDILLLFITSHGARAGVGLQLPRRPPALLAARDLAAMLDGAGIRHRVVIVSACYSGTFVPPLANDDTIVITAADAMHPSFGCAPGREWTYFGDAFFNRSLYPGVDFQRAFNDARMTISAWELADKLTPSNPQAHFGPALLEKLTPLFAAKGNVGR
jgi:hypothetical protein